MKPKYLSFISVLLITVSFTSFAQQQPNFLFFEQNMGIYNPAFTGTEGQFVGLGYRAAWSGIEDAPRANSLVYNTNEKNKASWGFSFLSDRVYVENQGMISVDYSYRLQLNDQTNLHLGIKAGANYNNIDLERLDRITQENNESLGNIQNYLNPLLGVGAYLTSKTYFFGLSVPNFLNTKRFKEINGIQATATDKPHLYASGGFTWKLNNTISLEPAFLYRMVNDAPNQITAIGKINLKDQLELGMGVSNNDYISAMLAFKGMKLFDFGYGYEMGQRTSSTALRANTHELFLTFKFGDSKANNQTQKEDNKDKLE
ncbi:PorP/SprF family type IX secretion system membrane protein [Flavobacteriaceae bacterium LSUCC0859]|nr:PorP/SprF family type IX secretion system membrane protein [Flavobacteriaceae bacterium LSUCC0859]